jgi:hypothetical protein
MKLYLKIGILILGLSASPTIAETKSIENSVVGISLSKIMAALGSEQESLRETEGPTAILLYPADERIETAFLKLKNQLKDYERIKKVRIDFLTSERTIPDYTEDFLNYLNDVEVENDE